MADDNNHDELGLEVALLSKEMDSLEALVANAEKLAKGDGLGLGISQPTRGQRSRALVGTVQGSTRNPQGKKEFDPTRVKCYNCNELGHMANKCPRPVKCKKCKGEGHLAKACPDNTNTNESKNLNGKQA